MDKMSGKKEKIEANKKEKKNQDIADTIMAYYLSEQEMPEYIAGVGTAMQDHYKTIITGMTTHIGMISANLKQIEKEVNASSLSKASKAKINKWIDVSVNDNEDVS